MVDTSEQYYFFDEVFFHEENFCFDNEMLREITSRALTKVPSKIVDDLFNNCLAIIQENDASYYPNHIFKNKSLIVFSEKIKEFSKEEREDLVMQEVAHFHLRHKSFFDKDNEYIQALKGEEFSAFYKESMSRFEKQEVEADKTVKLWLDKYEQWRKKDP